jgi:hypothetical protein
VTRRVTNYEVADALEKCDWRGVSIGQREILRLAIQRLRAHRKEKK